jgi:hypothetical protein
MLIMTLLTSPLIVTILITPNMGDIAYNDITYNIILLAMTLPITDLL